MVKAIWNTKWKYKKIKETIGIQIQEPGLRIIIIKTMY